MWTIYKAKLIEGHVGALIPKTEFDENAVNFLTTMCANPQCIVEFPAYTEESARKIAEFMAKEHMDTYPETFPVQIRVTEGQDGAMTYDGIGVFEWMKK